MNTDLKILRLALFSLSLIILMAGLLIFSYLRKKEVTINTAPEGVHYKINSMEGSTPTKIKLRPGKYQIELFADGYETLKEQLKVGISGKTESFKYDLKKVAHTPSSSALEMNFGGGRIDAGSAQSKIDATKKKYPFYDKLPVKGENFYISIPDADDRFFIYIAKGNLEQGKQAALGWFSQNDTTNTATLKIVWIYR